MTLEDQQLVMQKMLQNLQRSKKWLIHSYEQCQHLDLKAVKKIEQLPLQDLDSLEGLASRFSRASDILFQKLYRTIDYLEMTDGGSLLDALHRAQKRGIINTIEEIRAIRDVRNQIVHEYSPENLLVIFQQIILLTPRLLGLIEATQNYCRKFKPD